MEKGHPREAAPQDHPKRRNHIKEQRRDTATRTVSKLYDEIQDRMATMNVIFRLALSRDFSGRPARGRVLGTA
jgi:hypothetical protein